MLLELLDRSSAHATCSAFRAPFPVQSAHKRRGWRGAFASNVQPFPGALQLLAFPLPIASYREFPLLILLLSSMIVCRKCQQSFEPFEWAVSPEIKNKKHTVPLDWNSIKWNCVEKFSSLLASFFSENKTGAFMDLGDFEMGSCFR